MVQVELVAVLLGLEFASHPFASVNAELGTPKRLAILPPADTLIVGVLALHPVVRAVIGNFEDLIEQGIRLQLSRARVLFRECWFSGKPLADCRC